MYANPGFCKCSQCGKDIIDDNYVCFNCYQEKDRQVRDLLNTIEQLRKFIHEAIEEIDLALRGE